MRVPLSWLREYVDVELAPEALAERLTLLGMEVKGIERGGVGLATTSSSASCSRSSRIPASDHLLADHGPHRRRRPRAVHRLRRDEHRGRPARAGRRCPVPSCPATGASRSPEWRVARARACCAPATSCALTTDADGILILPPDAPLGAPMADLFGDVVLDVDVKPNRGDALSMRRPGARGRRGHGGLVRWPEMTLDERAPPRRTTSRSRWRTRSCCPRFVGRYVDGVHGRAVAARGAGDG